MADRRSNFLFQSAYPFLLVAVLVALALPLMGYAYTGTFMRYSGDDYCYAAELFQRGFWHAQWDSYLSVTNYSGNRYALTLLSGLSGLLGPRSAGALPALAIILWIGGTIFALRGLHRQEESGGGRLELALAGVLLVFYTLYLAPDLSQVLYWRSGMLPYLAPLIANTFLIGMIVRAMRLGRTSVPALLAIAAMALLGGGFSETGVALQVGYLGMWLIAVLLRRSIRSEPEPARSLALMVALAASLMAMALLILSPINSLRQSQLQLPDPPSLSALTAMSFQNAYLFAHATVRRTFIPHLAIVLCAAGLAGLRFSRSPLRNARSARRLLLASGLIPAIAYLLIVFSVAPSAYAQSSYPVARAMLTARFVTVIAAAALGAEIGRAGVALGTAKIRGVTWLPLLAGFFVVLSGVYPIRAVPDILTQIPRYRKWASFWDARDLAIRQARGRGESDIAVVQIDHIIPNVAELSPDVGYWYNNCAERYYDIGSLSASLPGWDK
ncbi:MAG TPA: DUF6056 family protein [Anaerolineales bacterium]|nr:DUF6056 family protein [Anaerolineales bacterium]